MAIIDYQAYYRWGRKEAPYDDRYWSNVAGLYHLILRLLEIKFSPARLFLFIVRGISGLAVALAPVAFKYFKEISDPGSASLPWSTVLKITAVMVSLIILNKIIDTYKKYSKDRIEIQQNENSLSAVLNNATERLSKCKLIDYEERDLAIIRKDILCAVRHHTRLTLRHFDEKYLEVSLLVFDGPDFKKIKISERALAERPIDRKINSKESMAFYVAKTKNHRFINNFRKGHPFKKRGISSESAPYKSILFIPIIKIFPDGKHVCYGVLSIDSARPYEFWGGAADRIVVKVQPYLNMLRMLISDLPALDVT